MSSPVASIAVALCSSVCSYAAAPSRSAAAWSDMPANNAAESACNLVTAAVSATPDLADTPDRALSMLPSAVTCAARIVSAGASIVDADTNKSSGATRTAFGTDPSWRAKQTIANREYWASGHAHAPNLLRSARREISGRLTDLQFCASNDDHATGVSILRLPRFRSLALECSSLSKKCYQCSDNKIRKNHQPRRY